MLIALSYLLAGMPSMNQYLDVRDGVRILSIDNYTHKAACITAGFVFD
jgi:hypothetical protein